MELKKFNTRFGDKDIFIETGKMAGLADSAVTVRYGDTVVLATVVVGKEPREGVDFFPLLVDYEERLYAAGKISGSRFIKREGRPSDVAILTARLIDRPLRPLFPKAFRNDVQIIVTVLSTDRENDPDIISIIAASASLMLSGAPFKGPVGAARVGYRDGKYFFNPTRSELESSDLDIVVAGTEKKVMMLEAGANELDDEKVLGAIEFAQKNLSPIIELQEKIAKDIGKIKAEKIEEEIEIIPEILSVVKKYLGDKIKKAVREADKEKRAAAITAFERQVLENFEGNYKQVDLKTTFGQLVEKEVRTAILDEDARPDGRKLDEIRPISMDVSLLPRTHGSALFTRGQTQVLSIVTLGPPGDEQIIETMEEEGEKRFMHHYNFPPFSTGEVKPVRGASRREIGHGALAERALVPMIPPKEEFPYTIRVVSEVLSSNGSSSMASTCGATLALLDAGVPIRRPVTGIAIGLMTEMKQKNGEEEIKRYKLLTDIQGLEDFSGDMDFKITGTEKGITAIQLDIKINGLNLEIIKETFKRAKIARLIILEKIKKLIPEPRKELSPYAPRITSLKINPEKIGDVIGPGGKIINKIIQESGGKEITSIDIEEDGTVTVSSTDPAQSQKAVEMIKSITRELAIGEIIEGEVKQIQKDRMTGNEIGAIVQLTPKTDGMVHISQISAQRIGKVSDVLHVGDKVKVKIVDIDRDRGRISLTMKGL